MAPNNDSNPQAGQGRPLPKKEADLFKNVVKHYEMKQYKKATKQADTILKKYPNHGETLAMKGLILNCLTKGEEAHALVKEGLMHDMRSHVCWHVYGLLHRSDHNYNEAIKAYKQALRIDSDNIQILRDLSMLQIQMRDLDGFAITRHNILSLKPNGKINWLAFALAKHLTGDLRGAVSVIDIYLGTLTEGAPELARGFEACELALYRNTILAEIPNNYKEALEHLSVCENVVVDRSAWLIAKATYQLKMGDYADAKQTTLDMFRRGMTENFKVHSMYMCAILELDSGIFEEAFNLPGTRTLATLIPLSDEQKQKVLDGYKNELFPEYAAHSAAMQRAPMNLATGDQFRNALDTFMRKWLVKGVPSLCNELSSFLLVDRAGRYELAKDPMEVREHAAFKLIVDIVDGYISCLASKSKLLPDDEFEEPPSTALWVWYLRGGLHELAGEYAEGIAMLDKCLEHTPTAVDVYEVRARLEKAAGDINVAVASLDKGRDLDRQDRYINNQTTKYMLQAGMEDDALQRISMFTKHEGNPEANLYDMQCSWYELELASCYANKQEWGKSLKKYSAVVKHFDDFHEDQFDFHAYCIRKVTLRAYMEVLRFEDTLLSEDYYFRAASGIIGIYLHLHDHPAIRDEGKEPDYSKMSAADRKKAKAIARKKKNQAEKKEADKKKKEEEEAQAQSDDKKGPPEAVDEDPDGKELMKKDVLEEAKNYASILAKYSPKRLDTWTLQYDVSIRREKTLLALQALFKMKSIAPNHSEYFSRLVDFAVKMPTFTGIPEAVKSVITQESATLLNQMSATEFVAEAADRARKDATTDLPTRVAIAQALAKTSPSSTDAAASIIVDGGVHTMGVSVETSRQALAALKGLKAEAATKQWITAVKERFPLLSDLS